MATHETPPSAPWMEPAYCVCFNVRRAARALSQRYDREIAPSGLRGNQFTLLQVVASAGPATMQQLAGVLVMDRTTLTRNLRPLAQAGLVEIRPGTDRRTREVAATEAGRAALAEAMPRWRVAQADMLAQLGAERWERLLPELAQVIEAAGGV